MTEQHTISWNFGTFHTLLDYMHMQYCPDDFGYSALLKQTEERLQHHYFNPAQLATIHDVNEWGMESGD